MWHHSLQLGTLFQRQMRQRSRTGRTYTQSVLWHHRVLHRLRKMTMAALERRLRVVLLLLEPRQSSAELLQSGRAHCSPHQRQQRLLRPRQRQHRRVKVRSAGEVIKVQWLRQRHLWPWMQ